MLQIIENSKLQESLVKREKTFLIRQKLKLIIEIILMKINGWKNLVLQHIAVKLNFILFGIIY